MDATDFLALAKAAGLPPGLPLRDVDQWVAERLGVSDRAARRWRLTGHVPGPAVAALRGMVTALTGPLQPE